ncbi:hypothetical protein KP509_04G057900 [Ceratopteris richardii]|uniref:Aminoacyl-transfer RNA synthetases class-II family profile domain-containing protein n=1 Tax=Ceratopteris richardii TaxID=49495 RepID=A0A8T2V536_CERRI|nr:hypothetical protein KP509_04G057900 [Ceratopteris richardii]
MQKKRLSRGYLRIRNALDYGTHKFFQERGFIWVASPIITASDCEGAGEQFCVTTLSKDFFGKPTFLTVSGQLNAEIYATTLSDVYTFGPTFRAENSNTTRHLAEFWMIEPELAFADLKDVTACAASYLQYVVNDDSCLSNLQCIVGSDTEGFGLIEVGSVSTGASVAVEG